MNDQMTTRELRRSAVLIAIATDMAEMDRLLSIPESQWPRSRCKRFVDPPPSYLKYDRWRLQHELKYFADTDGGVRTRPMAWMDSGDDSLLRWVNREIRKMDREGLVERLQHPSSGKYTHVRLTSQGHVVVEQLLEKHRKDEATS